MTSSLSLKNIVDKAHVKFIAETKPDELAPQLSVIVRELLENEHQHIKMYGIGFIKSTVLTETFKEILREVFTSLHNNTSYTAWLNLDMGSGKTHLLTLLVYLIYGYRYLKEELEEYSALGLNENLAKETALFVVDLRTPSEILTTFLPFFVKSLEKVEEFNAAKYVESCIKENRMPEVSELVRRLKRENTRFIAIIDELHHAVLTYRSTQSERRWVRDVIEFVTSLIDYLRHYRRGFAILVASARRDYERVNQLPEKDELILLAENLISQIGRLKPVLETKWLSIEEAKKIILKRLGAQRDVIHKMFNGFIERIVKAESDIPQAQHLRSLIKAMAIFTLNAINEGHCIVTPLTFSEKVIDALFPEGGDVAERYKSIYSHINRVVGDFDEEPEVRKIALLVVNAIFTTSMTGRSDLLIEIIRAYKLGRYSGLIPAISEREIEELLSDIGFRDISKISRALNIVNSLEYIHSVKRGDTYIYFVVPIISVVSQYNKYINDRYKSILMNRESLVDKFIDYLRMLSDYIDKSSQIIIANAYEDLESITKRISPDIMYLIIYAEPELAKYLEEKLRITLNINIIAELNEWMKKKGRRDLSDWLRDQHRFNIAIAVPVPFDDVLSNIARYCAIEEATAKVVQDYLLEYLRSESRLREEMKKLIEVELDEIHKALGNRLIEAVELFVKAYSKALSHVVYIYRCTYEPSSGINCKVSAENLEVTDLESSVKKPITLEPSRELYSKLIDTLHIRRDTSIRDLSRKLVERVKSFASFVDDISKAYIFITQDILEKLKDAGEYRLSKDMNTFVHKSQIIYIPPSIVSKVAESISIEDLRKKFEEQVKDKDINIVKREEEKTIVFEITKKLAKAIPEIRELPTLLEEKREVDYIMEALKVIDSYDRGEIHMKLIFDKSSKGTLKTYINALKKYIKELEVKPS